MHRSTPSSAHIKRVVSEVHSSIARWSAGPIVVIAEPDRAFRDAALLVTRQRVGTLRIVAPIDEREALTAVATNPAVILWLAEDPALDTSRVAGEALRRCPIAVIALRCATVRTGPSPLVDLPTAIFQQPAASLVKDFANLAGAAIDSWSRSLERFARREISRRLAERLSAAEIAAAGYDPPEQRGEPTLFDATRALLIERLLRHHFVVSKAAASLGIERKSFYRKCKAHDIDVEALRRQRFDPGPESRRRRP